jgi:hypothetical protein
MYHGGLEKISTIDLSKCRDHTDFGKGFYVTRFREQAEYWAKRQGERNNAKGEVTEFTIYNGLFTDQLFKTLQFETYSEEWLDFIVKNRNAENESPAHDYDIVEGPVANDDVTREITKYLDGEISKMDFLKQLTYHKETHQVCFCTYRSLLAIKPIHEHRWFEINTTTITILTTLMLEKEITEAEAADILYTSKTFAELVEPEHPTERAFANEGVLDSQTAEAASTTHSLQNKAVGLEASLRNTPPDSGLSKKSWQEVYELLKKELGK